MSENPKAYEGKENYIFVSYAHKDREQVFKILSELEKRGYRFWYDDGIAPGSEWAEEIAMHLSDSYAVMAMITQASADSDNCRREITYALSKRKPFISVVLEKADMSAGLELQLSAQQSVIKYNYKNYESFIKKLLSSPDIEPCREIPVPEEAEEAEAEEAKKVDKFYTLYRENEKRQRQLDEEYEKLKQSRVSAEEKKPLESEAVSGRSAEEVKKKETRESKENRVDKKEKNKAGSRPFIRSKGGKLVIGAIALIGIIAVLAETLLYYTASWGEKYKRSSSYITIKDQTIKQKDIDNFAKFKELDDMAFVNCDFSSCDPAPLADIEELDYLRFANCTGIEDYHFLNDCHLSWLTVNKMDSFSDISSLDYSKLRNLDLRGTSVSDISAVKDSDVLEELDISFTNVTNADAAMSCSSLKSLSAEDCRLDDFKDKCEGLELYFLNVHNCGISDLSAFSDCTRLTSLDVGENSKLTDMSWLNRHNSETLTSINVSKTGLDKDDISFLSDCSKLEDLYLDEVAAGSLDFCSSMSELKRLSAQGCGIEDISGLENCASLQTLFLGFNDITDVKPLQVLQKGKSSEDYTGIILDLSFNSLSSVSDLSKGNYDTIILLGNDPKIASTVKKDIKTDNLCVEWFDGITDVWFAKESGVSKAFITGTPKDELVRTEKAFEYRNPQFVSMDEFYNEILIDAELGEDAVLKYSGEDFVYNGLGFKITPSSLETAELYNARQ